MIKEFIDFLLRPLLNERGQYFGIGPGGYTPGAGVGMAPDSEEETREYQRFLTSEPSGDYGDLISKYKDLYAGGASSYDAYQQMQTERDLERIRNTLASRGLGGRSGVGVSAAAQYMSAAGPRHAMQKADYMGKLMSDYAHAVSGGRKGYGLAQTKATSKRGAPRGGGAGAGGGPAFQWQPSRPIGGGGSVSGGGGSSWDGGDAYGTFGGGGGGSPYIPGGMEAAGYSQIGDSGAYGKTLFPAYDEGAFGAFGTGGYTPSDQARGRAQTEHERQIIAARPDLNPEGWL